MNKFIGNDDTGNGTNEKLYKTLDKAISQIKSGVPMIWMYLQGKINGTQEENTYTCTQCIYLGSNQNLSLVMSYGDYYLKGVRLNLVVPYVKIPSNYDYSMSRYNYVYGNILINGGNHISIECINLVFPDNTHQDAINYTNCITRFSTSLNLSFVNLSITKHSFLALMNGTSLQLAINKNSHVYGKGLFIRSVGSIDHVIDWDGTVNISGETTDVTTKTHVITSAIIEGYSSLDLGISSVGQHGISNGFYIVFKNF